LQNTDLLKIMIPHYLIKQNIQNSDVDPSTLLNQKIKISLEYATIIGRVYWDGYYYRLADAYWLPSVNGNPPACDFTYLFSYSFNLKDLTIL
jgi:hypothetical protein